jgi:hypothetical protein
MYLHRDTTFFTDEFRLKLLRKTDILKSFHFESLTSLIQ